MPSPDEVADAGMVVALLFLFGVLGVITFSLSRKDKDNVQPQDQRTDPRDD